MFLDFDNWREIVATLSRNKTRTFLTAFGIFWGTAMLAMLWGGATGLIGIMQRNFAGLSTNLGALASGTRTINYKGFNKGSTWSMTLDDIATIKQVAPAIDKISALSQTSVTAVAGSNSYSCMVMGVQPDYYDINAPSILSGRFINDADENGCRKVCAIGTNLASELFPDSDPVGQRVELGGIYFTVVGVVAQRSDVMIGGRIDDNTIIPESTMCRTFNTDNKIGFMMFTATDGHSPSDNEEAIRRTLSTIHSIDPNDDSAFGFMNFAEQFEMINNLFVGLTILAIFVGLASLLAGVIGVGNIMWIVVKERTHEFGIRRAIGAKPSDITREILSESILLTVVAGIAGICFATYVLYAADMLTASPTEALAGFQMPFWRAISIVVVFIFLGSIAGTLPAIKAMKIKPIEALRTRV